MLAKIWGLVALVLVLSASYTLWKSGIQSEANAALTNEINQQTEKKVEDDKTKVEQIFIDGSDDAVIDSVVSGVLAAESAENDYDGQLWRSGEDPAIPLSVIQAGAVDVELQDGSSFTQDSREGPSLASIVEESVAIDEPIPGEALILTPEEMAAAQIVLGNGCISEVIYLETGLTKTVETCPEND